MAANLRGEVNVTLGDRCFVLRPSFSAIMDIEERLGGIVALALRASRGEYGLKDVATVICCTIRQSGNQRPTLDEIGELVLQVGLASAADAMKDILTVVLGGETVSGRDVKPGKA